jgi:hypothetical protein
MIRDLGAALYLVGVMLLGAVVETARELVVTNDVMVFDREMER